jgi:hypothetical protein
VVVTQEDKENVVYQHFMKHIGTYAPRICNLNIANLGWQPKPLSHLENSVTEELQLVIAHAPKEKAPRPDEFIGLFFSWCWNIIKHDLLEVVEYFFSMNQQDLHFLNRAYIVLIPKKTCPQKVADYRPISLIQSFAKLVSKILAKTT